MLRLEAARVAQGEDRLADACQIVMAHRPRPAPGRHGHRHQSAAERLERARGLFEIRLHLGAAPQQRDVDRVAREAGHARDVARHELVHEPQQEHAAGLRRQAPRARVAAGRGDIVPRLRPLRGRERARGELRGVEVGDRERRFRAIRAAAQARRVEIPQDGPQVGIQVLDRRRGPGARAAARTNASCTRSSASRRPPVMASAARSRSLVALEEHVLERVRPRKRLKQAHVSLNP